MQKMTKQELEWSREAINLFVDVLFWFEEYGDNPTPQEDVIFKQRMKTMTEHIESEDYEIRLWVKALTMMTVSEAQDNWRSNREKLAVVDFVIDTLKDVVGENFPVEFSQN